MSYICCHCHENILDPQGPVSAMLFHSAGEFFLPAIKFQKNALIVNEGLDYIREILPVIKYGMHEIQLSIEQELAGTIANFTIKHYKMSIPAIKGTKKVKGHIILCCQNCHHCCTYDY